MAHHVDNTAAFDVHVQTWRNAGTGNNPGGFSMTPSFVGVVDIGQGSTNAIFNANGQVILYFDLGGGSSSNRFTFPDHAQVQLGPKLCNHARPRFILSHWDWDHWRGIVPAVSTRSVAQINANALCSAITANTTWAAMQQGMGGIHLAVRQRVYNATDFHERSTVGGAQFHAFGAFRIIRCAYNTAHGGADNNTGFGLRIEDPANAGQYILLPGDAHYPNIQAHGTDQALQALVVTHHGEPTVQADVPRPLAGANRPLVYSFGSGNKYGHPRRPDGITPYVNRGYPDATRFFTAGRAAGDPNYGQRGNVAIRFAGAAAGPGVAAGAGANQVLDAAIAILASATTAATVAGQGCPLTRAQIGHVAAAASYQAAIQSVQAQAAAIGVALAAAPLVLFGPFPFGFVAPPPQTPCEIRAATHGVPSNELADALAAAPAAAASVLTAAPGCQDYLLPIGNIVANGHSDVSNELTTVVNGVAAWPAIGTRSARATERAFARTRHAATITATANTLSALPSATAIMNAIGGGAPPTILEVGTAASEAAYTGARWALGYSAFQSGAPHAAAEWIYNRVRGQAVAAVTNNVSSMMAAAAAMKPKIPVNPEHPIIAALGAGTLNNLRDMARPAVAAAYAGAVLVGANYEHVAKVAVAAARAAVGCAAGLPQPGCHRHPMQCGANTCSLTLHYGV